MFKSPLELLEDERLRALVDQELAADRAADEAPPILPLWLQLRTYGLRAVMPRRWDR